MAQPDQLLYQQQKESATDKGGGRIRQKNKNVFSLFYPHTLTHPPGSPCLSRFRVVRDSVRGVRVRERQASSAATTRNAEDVRINCQNTCLQIP